MLTDLLVARDDEMKPRYFHLVPTFQRIFDSKCSGSLYNFPWKRAPAQLRVSAPMTPWTSYRQCTPSTPGCWSKVLLEQSSSAAPHRPKTHHSSPPSQELTSHLCALLCADAPATARKSTTACYHPTKETPRRIPPRKNWLPVHKFTPSDCKSYIADCAPPLTANPANPLPCRTPGSHPGVRPV